MLHTISAPIGRWNRGYEGHRQPLFFMAFVIDAIMNGIQNVASILYGCCDRCHNECYTQIPLLFFMVFVLGTIMNIIPGTLGRSGDALGTR